MGKSRKSRLIKLQDFLKQTTAEVIGGLGLGGGIRTMYRQLSVLDTEERAFKRSDLWIKEGIRNKTLLVKNRFTKETINIPIHCLVPSLRRHSGIGYLDVTEKIDFLIKDVFPDMDRFFDDQKMKESFEKRKSSWNEYIERRLGEVLVARKFDLSASGTHLLCFYSSISLVPGEFWLIRNLGSKFARIFCLWFNSTPNLVQMFLNRTETRGAWMKTDISSLKEMYLIDPRTLTENEEEELLESFEVMANCELPSIVEQLRTMHHVRKKVDMMILKIIGFEGSEIESMLSYLYPALANEIEKLKTLMEG